MRPTLHALVAAALFASASIASLAGCDGDDCFVTYECVYSCDDLTVVARGCSCPAGTMSTRVCEDATEDAGEGEEEDAGSDEDAGGEEEDAGGGEEDSGP